MQRVVERLDAEAVAREHEPAAARIPQGHREHAAEPLEAVLAELLVQMDDDLDVAGGREAVSASLQLGAQLDEVVELAVADDGDAAVLARDRLVARLQIDDGEPAHRERRAAARHVPGRVRPTVAEQREVRQHLDRGEVECPEDAAHVGQS